MKLFVGPPTSAEAVDETKKDEPETAKVHEPKVFTVMPQPMPVAIQLPPSPPPPPRRRSFCTPLLVALCCAFFFFVLVVASLHGPYIGHRWHKDRAEHLIIDLGPLKALQDDVKSAALTSENKKEDEETKDEKMKVLLQSGPAASKMFIFGQQETDTPKEEKPVEEEERPRSIFLFRPLMQNLEERRPLHPYEVQPFEGGPNPWEEMAARREMAMRLWRWRRIQEAMMAERAAREQFMAFRLRQFAEFQHQRQLEEEQAAAAAHWQQMQFLQQQQQQQQQQQAPVQEESTPFVPPFLLRRAILQHLISQGAIPQPRVFMFLQRPPQFQQQQPFQAEH